MRGGDGIAACFLQITIPFIQTAIPSSASSGFINVGLFESVFSILVEHQCLEPNHVLILTRISLICETVQNRHD